MWWLPEGAKGAMLSFPIRCANCLQVNCPRFTIVRWNFAQGVFVTIRRVPQEDDAQHRHTVFARKGRANQVDFTNFSGVYGGGFIAEASRLRGKLENCLIKSRKESGQTINLVVACAKGIMLSNVQFFLKVLDDNTISREFPGMEGMDVTYHRCQI